MARAVEKGDMKSDADIKSIVNLIFIFSQGMYLSRDDLEFSTLRADECKSAIDDFVTMMDKVYCTGKP